VRTATLWWVCVQWLSYVGLCPGGTLPPASVLTNVPSVLSPCKWQAFDNPVAYGAKLRLLTALEVLRVALQHIAEKHEEVRLFLCVSCSAG